MPNEPRNKTGRTLRQQIKAAADATAAEKAAREDKRERRREGADASSKGGARSSRHERGGKDAADDSAKGTSAGASKRSGRLTKRHASQEQQDQLKKERKQEREANKEKLEGFHPIKAALELFGNMGLGYRILTGFVVFVVVVFAVLYPIGCTYYQAMRQQQQLEAVLDAVNQRNDQIENKNKQLETDEGVENQARDEYGWVKDGEHATVVTNSDDDGAGEMPSQVDETKIEPPHTWYYDILDVIFQSKI